MKCPMPFFTGQPPTTGKLIFKTILMFFFEGEILGKKTGKAISLSLINLYKNEFLIFGTT
jgi:hypothetical protein